MAQNFDNEDPIKDVVVSKMLFFYKLFFKFVKMFLNIMGWVVIPFIPLYLSLDYPILFYIILSAYSAFFIVWNHYIMNYPMEEVCIFLIVFLLCVYAGKELLSNSGIEGKDVVKTGITLGIL